jgi:hypothetical protein
VKKLTPFLAAFFSAFLAAPMPFYAASHQEAPLTALDHPADITDFFAFVSYDDPSKVMFLLNVDPPLEPANGPNYFPFDPDVLYSIKSDNTYDAVEDISFEFRFTTEIRAPGVFTGFVGAGSGIDGVIPPAITALDGAGSAGLSLRQKYTVTMVTGSGATAVRTDLTPANQSLFAVPSNVGPRTMPDYPALAKQGIYSLGKGIRVFACTVDDPFYIDLGGTFDSLNFRTGAFLSGNPPLLTADVGVIGAEVEAAHLGIGLAFGEVVVSEDALVQIGGADGQAQVADADAVAGGGKQLVQDRRPLGGVHVDKVLRAAAGEGKAEAVDGLELATVVDLDGGGHAGRREETRGRFLAGEEGGLIGIGQPDFDVLCAGGGCGEA